MKYILFIFIILTSCTAGTSFIETGNMIDDVDKEIIRSDLSKIYYGIKNKDFNFFAAICTDSLFQKLNDKKKFDDFIGNFNLRDSFKCSNVSSEYLIRSDYVVIDTISARISILKFNTFDLTYPLDKYVYIAQYRILGGRKTSYNLLSIFKKNDKQENWRLASIYLSISLQNGKNAIDYFNIAKSEYQNDSLVGAALNIMLCKVTCHPGATKIHYHIESKIDSLYTVITNGLKVRKCFPFCISEISNHPKIWGIGLTTYKTQVFPYVTVQTDLRERDSILLKNESYEISKYIHIYMPNIDSVNKGIIYEFVKLSSTSPDSTSGIYTFLAN